MIPNEWWCAQKKVKWFDLNLWNVYVFEKKKLFINSYKLIIGIIVDVGSKFFFYHTMKISISNTNSLMNEKKIFFFIINHKIHYYFTTCLTCLKTKTKISAYINSHSIFYSRLHSSNTLIMMKNCKSSKKKKLPTEMEIMGFETWIIIISVDSWIHIG